MDLDEWRLCVIGYEIAYVICRILPCILLMVFLRLKLMCVWVEGDALRANLWPLMPRWTLFTLSL
jgi:hypothetical protein